MPDSGEDVSARSFPWGARAPRTGLIKAQMLITVGMASTMCRSCTRRPAPTLPPPSNRPVRQLLRPIPDATTPTVPFRSAQTTLSAGGEALRKGSPDAAGRLGGPRTSERCPRRATSPLSRPPRPVSTTPRTGVYAGQDPLWERASLRNSDPPAQRLHGPARAFWRSRVVLRWPETTILLILVGPYRPFIHRFRGLAASWPVLARPSTVIQTPATVPRSTPSGAIRGWIGPLMRPSVDLDSETSNPVVTRRAMCSRHGPHRDPRTTPRPSKRSSNGGAERCC